MRLEHCASGQYDRGGRLATRPLRLLGELVAERRGIRRPTGTDQCAQVIEVRATVAGFAKMHLDQRVMPQVGVLDRADRVVSRQSDEPEDSMDAMHDPGVGALSVEDAEQHALGVVELTMVCHGKAEVVARLRFVPLQLAVDGNLEVFVGVAATARELPPPQIDGHEMAERVRDRTKDRRSPGLPRAVT